jgi:mRNA interferase RelE/StbE
MVAGRFEIIIDKSFAKELRAIVRGGRPDMELRVEELLDELELDPVTARPGADVKRLKGEREPTFRARLGDYRVLYTVDERKRQVLITTIFHRGRGY